MKKNKQENDHEVVAFLIVAILALIVISIFKWFLVL